MLDARLRSRLRHQRLRDEARTVCRNAALHALRVQAALKDKDLAEVRQALALLKPSLATLEPHERKLANRAGVWLGEHA